MERFYRFCIYLMLTICQSKNRKNPAIGDVTIPDANENKAIDIEYQRNGIGKILYKGPASFFKTLIPISNENNYIDVEFMNKGAKVTYKGPVDSFKKFMDTLN